MDDQSSTPMSDFLQTLRSKHAETTVQEPPAAAPAPAATDSATPASTATASEWPSADAAPGAEAVIALPVVAAKSEEEKAPDAAAIHANKVRIITKALRAMETNIANIIRLLEEDAPAGSLASVSTGTESVDPAMAREVELAGLRQVDGRVIEGVFDGSSMVGSDGKIYTVPPNYASKSKLVEGDLLKLTITTKGSFIYKQIGPIERTRVVATLGFDATNGEFYATQGERRWTIIKASVTYFKGEPDDEVILLVPKNTPSRWAAVENIIKQSPII